jgi:hypothetical protein
VECTVNYFELRDDMTVQNRWHLGEITLADGEEPQIAEGVPYRERAVPSVPVTHIGHVLDFSLTSFGVPIATSQIADVVAAVAKDDVQVVPVNIAGQSGMAVLNALRVVHCVDEARSEFIKWTKDDHRSDLMGAYRQVTNLVLDRVRIPADAHFFRVGGWVVALIVSEAVKTAIERLSVTGTKFDAV